MPLGKNIDDELLSGYLDGQLSRDERLEVESALQDDAAVRERLEKLRRVGGSLQWLASVRTRSLPVDFSSRIVALCNEAAVETVGPSVTASSSSSANETFHAKPKSNRNSWWIVANLTALAGAIVLAVMIPKLARRGEVARQPALTQNLMSEERPGQMLENQMVENQPVEGETAAPKANSMVSDRPASVAITYTLVLDLEQSRQAADQRVLPSLLEKHGIKVATGIQANNTIEKGLNQLRFTVKNETKLAELKPAELYLVRASAQLLDAALAEIETDVESFPAYRFDLIFETPVLDLARAIADSLNEQIASNSSVAAPVVRSSGDQLGPSSLESIPYQGHLVSNTRRQERFDSFSAPSADGETSYLLLLVRQQ